MQKIESYLVSRHGGPWGSLGVWTTHVGTTKHRGHGLDMTYGGLWVKWSRWRWGKQEEKKWRMNNPRYKQMERIQEIWNSWTHESVEALCVFLFIFVLNRNDWGVSVPILNPPNWAQHHQNTLIESRLLHRLVLATLHFGTLCCG